MAAIQRSIVTVPVCLFIALFLFPTENLSGRTVEQKGERQGGIPSLSRLAFENHDVNAVLLMVSNQGPIGLNMELNIGTGFFPSNTPNN